MSPAFRDPKWPNECRFSRLGEVFFRLHFLKDLGGCGVVGFLSPRRNRPPDRSNLSPARRDYYFFVTAGVSEGAGTAATRTASPVTSESAGLRMTLSAGVTPWTIWIVAPKSRPTLMSRSS